MFILGNDIAGERIVPLSEVVPEPEICANNVAADLPQVFPRLCANWGPATQVRQH